MIGYAYGRADPASPEKAQVAADALHARLKTARGITVQLELASADFLPLADEGGARDMEYFLDSAPCA